MKFHLSIRLCITSAHLFYIVRLRRKEEERKERFGFLLFNRKRKNALYKKRIGKRDAHQLIPLTEFSLRQIIEKNYFSFFFAYSFACRSYLHLNIMLSLLLSTISIKCFIVFVSIVINQL